MINWRPKTNNYTEKKNLHSVLKIAEALVSEADDNVNCQEVNITEGYRASLCCSGDVGGRPSEDDTSQMKLK